MYFFNSNYIINTNYLRITIRRVNYGRTIQGFSKEIKDAIGYTACSASVFVVIVLQMGGYVSQWFSHNVTKMIGIVMAVYLSLNTIMNFFSKSKKEKYIMTPLSFVAAICFWITAVQM